MLRTKIPSGIKKSCIMFNSILTILLSLLLMASLAGCGSPAITTSTLATKKETLTSSSSPAKPTGELVTALNSFGNGSLIPWTSDIGQIVCLVYDCLIYWDELNRKNIPGLAESWEVSPDALTTTFHLRRGVQFSDGWGELTAADVKFTMEGHAGKDSRGFTAQTRNIANMETPDPYTLVVHLKKPAPVFFTTFTIGNGGVLQGIVCKKYIETVGTKDASQKPVGTGPFKLVEYKEGSYYKLEAVESHWRVVPEFKNLTVRLIPEVSTIVAALKTKEIDAAMNIPAEQLADLQSAGRDTEVSPVGGFLLVVDWGGICLPIDDRYDLATHNKDPWVDIRVRKAMNISIDREAISKAIFAGAASPVVVPLLSADINKYLYPFDQAAAKQLLAEAGYPNGFSFRFISYTQQGIPETPRVVEAIAGYWQQIGLDPKITAIDYTTYNNNNRLTLKTAGDISLARIGYGADLLEKGATWLMPNYPMAYFQDEGSYALWQEGTSKVNFDEREAYVEKLNTYYYENFGPLVVCRTPYCYAWSDKISPPPHAATSAPTYFEYIRHAQPLNTFRLFTPWSGR
jgi:ABC-type transport system substrate-binding protein